MDPVALLARNLKRLRKLRGNMSQEELADKARVNRTYMGGIENGKHSVGLRTIDRLARALGVRACDLIDPEYDPEGGIG
jgi:transcriptional regulator with XRE-family HTH domain